MPVGLGAPADGGRIEDIRYEHGLTRFRLFGEEFSTPMMGEFNVRNCAMAIAAARFYQLSGDTIRRGLESFTGVRRRQEVRGVANGIKVVDDFGHHPTAIHETLRGLRQLHGMEGKIWALFEPRSNSTRRAVFQDQLAGAFEHADGVVMSHVAKLEQIPEGERLKPEMVVAAIRAGGKPAFYEDGTAAIIERTKELAHPGDMVVVFSNGGFDGIHAKLLAALAVPARPAPPAA